jgi:hypothetical protein
MFDAGKSVRETGLLACLGWASGPRNFMKNRAIVVAGYAEPRSCGTRTHACSIHTLQKPSTLVLILSHLWGRLVTCGRLVIGLSRSAPPPRVKDAPAFWGSPEKEPATRSPALPGTVSGARETLPKGSSFARVNAFCFRGCAKWGKPFVQPCLSLPTARPRKDRVEKPRRMFASCSSFIRLGWFFMKFRGRNAHPNRPGVLSYIE